MRIIGTDETAIGSGSEARLWRSAIRVLIARSNRCGCCLPADTHGRRNLSPRWRQWHFGHGLAPLEPFRPGIDEPLRAAAPSRRASALGTIVFDECRHLLRAGEHDLSTIT